MDETAAPEEDPGETIRRYYDALRAGERLDPFFVDAGPVVKVGIGERLVGAAAVAEGLREQTETTSGWTVESRDLVVGVGRDPGETTTADVAWFGDDVAMGWNDAERGIRFEFETRWSGAMVGHGGEWRFVELHVSTAGET